MMNEHGKSDRPVVPAKSPNKPGQPAAEGTEVGPDAETHSFPTGWLNKPKEPYPLHSRGLSSAAAMSLVVHCPMTVLQVVLT